MPHAGLFALAVAAMLGGLAPTATPNPKKVAAEVDFRPLRDVDMRLATIGERLAVANAPLCTDREPRTGMVVHDLAQYGSAYRDAARKFFGFSGPIAIEGVVAGSAADAAGVRANDVIVAIDDRPVEVEAPGPTTPVGTQRLIDIYRQLRAAGDDGRIDLKVMRGNQPRVLTIAPVSACATRYEVTLASGAGDLADGTLVQISAKMIEETVAEDELAAWIAHELAHNILRHRARLDAKSIDRGLLQGLGRNVGYIRRSEIEADMLAVSLVANAGYDAAAPARLWRRVGPSKFGSFLRARTHPRWQTRVKIVEREASRIAPQSVRPIVPPILAEREKPMSNDWQSLQAGL